MTHVSHGPRSSLPPLEWKTVHEIKGEDEVICRVQRRGDRRPLYSIQIGRLRRPDENGIVDATRLLPFIPVKIDGQGSVNVNRQGERLMREAHDWITEDAAFFEDQRVSHMISREVQSDDGPKVPRRTGKTDRDRNKHRRHDADADV